MLNGNYEELETFTSPKLEDDHYPDSISPGWIDIQEMKKLYPFNSNFVKNIDNLWLDHNVVGWKKSRGDGNCYYRAVISYFFLNICKPYESADKLMNFFMRLQQLNYTSLDPFYYQATDFMLKLIKYFIDEKVLGKDLQVFKYALDYCQQKEFDIYLVAIARLITYNRILKACNQDEYSFIGAQEWNVISRSVLKMGEEAEEVILVLLPQGLEVQVVQFMFLDQDRYSVQKFCEDGHGLDKIYIVRRHGHYDLLIKVDEMEMDQINLKDGSCMMFKDSMVYQDIIEDRKKLMAVI